MYTRCWTCMATFVLVVWSFVATPVRAQEQSPESQRIGPVLEVEKWVRYRKSILNWPRLHVDQLIFARDRIRTGALSKVSVQIERQRDIQRLGERTEIGFTVGKSECSLDDSTVSSDRRITHLVRGFLHIITDVFEEIHTPNSVVCVHGTTALIQFSSPPGTTEVVNLGGLVTVWNKQPEPRDRRSRKLESNSRVLVVGPDHGSDFALHEEFWREGTRRPLQNWHIVLLDRRRHAKPVPRIGDTPQIGSILPDTTVNPNALVDLTVQIPR